MFNQYLKHVAALPLTIAILLSSVRPCWGFFDYGNTDPSVKLIPKWTPPSVVPEIIASSGESEPGKELVQQAFSLQEALEKQTKLNALARYPTETKINELLYEAAQKGNGNALLSLTVRYEHAYLSIPKPLPTVPVFAEILLKHAQTGNRSAAYCIGILYDKNLIASDWSTSKRITQAYNWYRKSASAGLYNASVALGELLRQYKYMHLEGFYTPTQIAEAVELLKKAANVSDEKFQRSVSLALWNLDQKSEASAVNEKIAQKAFETGQNSEWWRRFFDECVVDKAVQIKWLSKLLDGPSSNNRDFLELRIDAYEYSEHPQLDAAIKDIDMLLSQEASLWWFGQKLKMQQQLGKTDAAWMTVRDACRSDAAFKTRSDVEYLCEQVEKLPASNTLSTSALSELLVQLNRCIEVDRNEEQYYQRRGQVLKRLGRAGEARRDFDTAERIRGFSISDD